MPKKRPADADSINPSRKPRAGRAPDQSDDVAGLRIVGGTHRGRKLAYSGDARTRPMKDRVREAVFNLVGPAVADTLAIDLFAGTGALGIEALSRGATQALFFEKHFPTADLIRENLRSLGLDDRARVVPCDTFLQVRRIRRDGLPATLDAGDPANASRPIDASRRWTVFCSPPFDFYVDREAEMLGLLGDLSALAPPGSIFVAESDRRFDPAKLPDADQWDVRDYAPAIVAVRR